MSSNETREILEKIAAELNEADTTELGYNHWEHAERLANQGGVWLDGDRQETEDECASYSICFDGGWNIDLSDDEWVVYPDADDARYATEPQA